MCVAVFGGLSLWRGHLYLPRVLLGLGGTLMASGVLIPSHLGPVYRGWMAFGRAINKVTSPIVIGAMYFVVLSPVGMLLRVLGRNPLRHRERNGGFWMPASSDGRSDLETQF